MQSLFEDESFQIGESLDVFKWSLVIGDDVILDAVICTRELWSHVIRVTARELVLVTEVVILARDRKVVILHAVFGPVPLNLANLVSIVAVVHAVAIRVRGADLGEVCRLVCYLLPMRVSTFNFSGTCTASGVGGQ